MPATSLEDLDQAPGGTSRISLALVDLAGFDERIWLRCDAMRRAGVPFLIISPPHLRAAHRVGLQRGATGVLVKPLVADELFGLINTLQGK